MELVEEIRKWVGHEFDLAEFPVSEAEILDFALAVGETEPRFTDPKHPDFQAPPTFTAKFVSRRVLPEGFPAAGARGFDAGKTVTQHAPVRAGSVLRGHSKIADVYEKTGRTGSMVFIVHRMEFECGGEPVATVDWRMVRQPRQERE
jgi:acyl dehydratase